MINQLCESRDAVRLLLDESILLGLSKVQTDYLKEISEQVECLLFEYEDKHILSI